MNEELLIHTIRTNIDFNQAINYIIRGEKDRALENLNNVLDEIKKISQLCKQ